MSRCEHDEPQRQTCKCCGFQDPWNWHVPDEVWRGVVPEALCGSVVCLRCFDGMAANLDIDLTPFLSEFYFAGRAANLTLQPMAAGPLLTKCAELEEQNRILRRVLRKVLTNRSGSVSPEHWRDRVAERLRQAAVGEKP